jgi:hypothetical protein
MSKNMDRTLPHGKVAVYCDIIDSGRQIGQLSLQARISTTA